MPAVEPDVCLGSPRRDQLGHDDQWRKTNWFLGAIKNKNQIKRIFRWFKSHAFFNLRTKNGQNEV